MKLKTLRTDYLNGVSEVVLWNKQKLVAIYVVERCYAHLNAQKIKIPVETTRYNFSKHIAWTACVTLFKDNSVSKQVLYFVEDETTIGKIVCDVMLFVSRQHA